MTRILPERAVYDGIDFSNENAELDLTGRGSRGFPATGSLAPPGGARLTRRVITGISTPLEHQGVLIPVVTRRARACGAAGRPGHCLEAR